MPAPPKVRIITRADMVEVMSPADYRRAVRVAFQALAAGQASSPQPMHIPVERGGFHAKGGSLTLERHYAAVKLNGNFPANPAELGLPTIQGAIILADGRDGVLLAILDSIEVTLQRTAAASAIAAQYLAAPTSHSLLICGAGEQGRAHAVALAEVLPLRRCLVWDRDPAAAERLARALGPKTAMEVSVAADLAHASVSADVIACCTTARQPYLDVEMVKPGAFIAAVGADSHEKSEVAPRLMAAAAVVADVVQQCRVMGDLNHAIAAGAMTEADVRAELGAVLTGAERGRRSPDEILIFDSTGTGLQDVAAAAAIYERCTETGRGEAIALAG